MRATASLLLFFAFSATLAQTADQAPAPNLQLVESTHTGPDLARAALIRDTAAGINLAAQPGETLVGRYLVVEFALQNTGAQPLDLNPQSAIVLTPDPAELRLAPIDYPEIMVIAKKIHRRQSVAIFATKFAGAVNAAQYPDWSFRHVYEQQRSDDLTDAMTAASDDQRLSMVQQDFAHTTIAPGATETGTLYFDVPKPMRRKISVQGGFLDVAIGTKLYRLNFD